jgi:hypothetical protein
MVMKGLLATWKHDFQIFFGRVIEFWPEAFLMSCFLTEEVEICAWCYDPRSSGVHRRGLLHHMCMTFTWPWFFHFEVHIHFEEHDLLNPFQALSHPFITGEPFTSPYEPVPETARIVSTILLLFLLQKDKISLRWYVPVHLTPAFMLPNFRNDRKWLSWYLWCIS